MPELLVTEKQGYDDHVAATGNPHGATLDQIGPPVADVNMGDQTIINLAAIVGQEGNLIASPGAVDGELQIEVPGDGASHATVDIPLLNNFFHSVIFHITGIDQSDQSQVYRRVHVLASCTSSVAKILGESGIDDRNAPDNGSIFAVEDSPYGDVSVTGGNFLRCTLAAHASHAVHYHVQVTMEAAVAYPV